MDTDINQIQSRFTAATIQYSDDILASCITVLKHAETTLKEKMVTSMAQLENNEKLWSGESKTQYLAIKEMLTWYRKDMEVAVTEYRVAVEGLQTLLNSIPTAKDIKEIGRL